MAELVTIDGRSYVKRDPLGVLGLSFITIGIYWLYWYYTINDEIRRYERTSPSGRGSRSSRSRSDGS